MADKIVNVALALAGGATAVGVPVVIGEYSKSDVYLSLEDISDIELGDDVRSILEERGFRLASDDDDYKTIAFWNWEKLPNIVSSVELEEKDIWFEKLSYLVFGKVDFESWRRPLYLVFESLHTAFKDFCSKRYTVDGDVGESWAAIQDVINYCTFPLEAKKYTEEFENHMLLSVDRWWNKFPETLTIDGTTFSQANVFANLENLCRRDLLFGDLGEDFGKTWCTRDPNKYPKFDISATYTLREKASDTGSDFVVTFKK